MQQNTSVLIDLTANSPSPCNGSRTTTAPACKSISLQPRALVQEPPPQQAAANLAHTTPTTPATAPSSTIRNPYSSTKKTTAAAPMLNPYSKKTPSKFVGGAEQARLNARKRPGKKIAIPKQVNASEIINRHMNAFDRFFAIMLKTPAADFLKAATKDIQAQEIWGACCRRAGVPLCTNPIAPIYSTASEHCNARAALVLEEARHSVSAGLETSWNRRKQPLYMTSQVQEKTRQGIIKTSFQKSSKFTKDELFSIRPGSIVQCLMRDDQPIISNAYLGVITAASRESVEKQRSFAVSFFVDDMPDTSKMDVSISFITQLVTECRCFEALTTMPHLAFSKQLLGSPEAQLKGVHTRFEDGVPVAEVEKEQDNTLENYFSAKSVKEEKEEEEHSKIFHVKKLNKAQEDAAYGFLNSASGAISIVQGPPGTGKTTLLVTIIGRALLQARSEGIEGYRLMVSAPTNKAISVLATRFLASINQDEFNVIMVGDQDKLLMDERNTNAADGALKSIFLYSWVQTMIETYQRIKSYFMPKYDGRDSVPTLCRLAAQQQHRLKRGLRCLDSKIIGYSESITDALELLGVGSAAHDIVQNIDKLLRVLKEMPNDVVWMNLMASADVIFCTLVSSGGMVLRKTQPINDLIVDEAAASTEPELYIPFHLRPSRLLIVGDPLQLPATCLAKKAIDFGLTKSLHERLMFDCKYKHVMLDVQYRMSCEISSFPSARFYDSKIANGLNVTGSAYFEGRVLLDRLPYIFLNVEGVEKRGFGGSLCNQIEANVIVDLIEQLRKNSSPKSEQLPSWNSSDRIRIITFYQAQVLLIKNTLQKRGFGNGIVVATVDSSQGCEADIVLISFVRSPMRNDPRPTHGFLQDDRRMNVALTRARYQLICVGNVKEFHRFVAEKTETIHMLAENAQERAIIRSSMSDLGELNTLDTFYGPPPKKKKSY